MKYLYIVWGLVFIIFIFLSINSQGESTNFYGIAETKEIAINSENPVEIKKIHTVQGQLIKTGDTILELKRPELVLKISEVSHLLSELKVQKKAKATLSKSQIRQLKAQQAAKVNEIKSQIRQLENHYELNKKLTADLRSIDDDKKKTQKSTSSVKNPILVKIANLKEELKLALRSSQMTINRLNNELSTSDNPVEIQVQRLEEELKLLFEEDKKLTIISQINGVIGSVNFREGEKVSPFTPIITIHNKSPSYIEGFIHEKVYNIIYIGQTVAIYSLTDKRNKITGTVVGVGSRIVEYPLRLRKRQDIQIWGREITIRLPDNNNFLLGEKVRIIPDRPVKS
ncbi:MAG: HlyD family efflux transporter periplasmic adaptor subunit [Chitinispirillia bacterium]|jgi:HlyD family secretion protein